MALRLWPKGLTGRVTLVLLAAILVEFAGAVLLFGEAERLMLRTSQAHRVAEQLVVADRVLSRTPPLLRPKVAPSLSTRHVVFGWTAAPPSLENAREAGQAVGQMLDWEPTLRDRALRVGLSRQRTFDESHLTGALRIGAGDWISFQSREPASRWYAPLQLIGSLIFLVGAVLLVSGLLVRTLASPLRALANATDRIGFESGPIAIEASGPQELRRLANAYNDMQTRISELLQSRTQALLAVSHDLRTPLARLKLRLHGRMRAGDLDALRGDVDELQAMLDSLLEYLGGNGPALEDTMPTDISALVSGVVDNAREMGADIGWKTPGPVDADVHPDALRRAVTNLVDNAVHYGTGTEVTIQLTGSHACIAVRDRGPGIPAESLPHVTTPFFREDSARARNTKGMGLGLAIVVRVAELHGGTLQLRNCEPGLLAQLCIPLVQQQEAATQQ